MGVYEVDLNYFDKYLDEIIPEDSEFKPIKNEIINIIFLDAEICIERELNDGYWPNESEDSANLYIPGQRYHIRITDFAIDFFENVVSGRLVNDIVQLYTLFADNQNAMGGVFAGIDIILFTKHLIKKHIVKMNDIEYCVYMQAITHLAEHGEFSLDDVISWFRINCTMHSKWECSLRKDDNCLLSEKGREYLVEVLKAMKKDKILKETDNGNYKIRY